MSGREIAQIRGKSGMELCLKAARHKATLLKELASRLSLTSANWKWSTSGRGHLTKQSLMMSIMLPLLLIFLLPSLKLENAHNDHHHHHHQITTKEALQLPLESTIFQEKHNHLRRGEEEQWESRRDLHRASIKLNEWFWIKKAQLVFNDLLMSLLSFPFDRLRLVSGLGAHAKEISNRQDLQEEETRQMLMAPAEHRSSYLAPPPQQQQQAVYHQSPHRGESEGVGVAQGGPQNQADLHQAEYAGGPQGELPMETGAGLGPVEGTAMAEPAGSGAGSSSGSSTGLQTRGDLPAVRALNVKCEKNHMTVNIVFDRPFYGTVFSKGHYNDQKCVHLPANSGQSSVNFDIHLGKCGMSSSDASALSHMHSNGNANGNTNNLQTGNQREQQPNGLFIENIIIIQYDPQVQEIYDQARKLRCTWYDYYEKSVTFRPYNVDMLDAVTANFLGDNIQCWMQIQVGKGPWSSEVAGIVKIGQTMTMVLAIKDDENRFDMLVRNCVAHDGKHQPIQLVDEYGCVARPKIMAKFQKVRNFGPAATVVSYAHFQAFKFPDSMSVHFQCVIQVCRYECPEPVCSGQPASLADAGAASQSPGAGGSATDYAASGTEIVSAKEPVPNAAVNLKLDEAQGRVQVKLDTSMMAGSGAGGSQQSARSAGGPLPPHLLHTAEPRPAPAIAPPNRGGHTYMSSSFFKPSSVGGSPQAPPSSAPLASNLGRPAMVMQSRAPPPLAPSGQQQSHYSSPYPQRNSAYAPTNRLGELHIPTPIAPEGGDADQFGLIGLGSPRALLLAPPAQTNQSSLHLFRSHYPAKNHRYRRHVNDLISNNSTNKSKKTRSAAHQDSTAIKTEKTIQVVSPEDVAFSFDDHELDLLSASGRHQRLSAVQQQDYQSTVCFSATKLISAILVTLAVLAASIVIVASILFRQRARLNHQKLASLYELSSDDLAPNEDPSLAPELGINAKAMQLANASRYEDMISRRQREEIQQRNTYLARLYSQFAPANYWR